MGGPRGRRISQSFVQQNGNGPDASPSPFPPAPAQLQYDGTSNELKSSPRIPMVGTKTAIKRQQSRERHGGRAGAGGVAIWVPYFGLERQATVVAYEKSTFPRLVEVTRRWSTKADQEVRVKVMNASRPPSPSRGGHVTTYKRSSSDGKSRRGRW